MFHPLGGLTMGPESVPISGTLKFKDETLHLERDDDHPVGAALLWDLGPLGEFHLETTRLPHRDKPYNLNLELARHRLMKIVQKQEDWNLFDFPRTDKFLLRFRETQDLLADALGKLEQPSEAAMLADQALALGVDLSEQLATFHADLLLNRRRAAGQFGKLVIGVRVDSEVQNQRYKDTTAANFDFVVVPMPWRLLQPEEGAFVTEPVDEWIEEMNRKRLPVVTGPLIHLAEPDVPDWMFIWEHDYDTLREMCYQYVQKVVTRYRKGVAVWNVVAGLNANRNFPLSFEQMVELTRLLVSQVKNMLPQARTIITVTQPFGEYHAKFPTTVPPMLYAEMVAQAGINFEGFGVELEMGIPTDGSFTRDLFQLSCMLDRFSTLGRPVFLTLGAPGRSTPDPGDTSSGKLDPSAAGRWHRPWDPDLQAEWIESVYHMALSKPFIEAVIWSNLADVNQTLPAGGLLDDMLQPKPAMRKVADLREKIQPWRK
jgi:hypothetical protein